MAETQTRLDEKLNSFPQATLDWCGDALFAGTPAEAIEFYQDLVKSGFQYFFANILDTDESTIDLMGTYLIPAFA